MSATLTVPGAVLDGMPLTGVLDAEDDRPIIAQLRQVARRDVERLLAEADPDDAADSAQIEARIRQLVRDQVEGYQARARTTTNTPRLVDPAAAERALLADFLGLGPLQTYLDDPTVEEIAVNGADRVFVWRTNGTKEFVRELLFEDDAEVVRLVQRAIGPLGRRLDAASPTVDARLPDGSRLNAIIDPISIDGPSVTIRKFPRRFRHIDELIARDMLTPELGRFLLACVAARVNILISGGTGAGKSTLLNVLGCCGITAPSERVVVIQETHELDMHHVIPDCRALEARPPNSEGQGEVTQWELLRNALRMRPSRVIVGEVRGAEAWEMLLAMATGHPGGLCTIHGASPRQALRNLALHARRAGENLDGPTIAEWIADTVQVVVQVTKDARTGHRYVSEVAEVDGLEGTTLRLLELWKRPGADQPLAWTGRRPKALEHFAAEGVSYALPATVVEAA